MIQLFMKYCLFMDKKKHLLLFRGTKNLQKVECTPFLMNKFRIVVSWIIKKIKGKYLWAETFVWLLVFLLVWPCTCLSPLCVRAEHSRYLTALILLASFWPCSLFIGECPFSARAWSASLSSRRSIFVPTEQDGMYK